MQTHRRHEKDGYGDNQMGGLGKRGFFSLWKMRRPPTSGGDADLVMPNAAIHEFERFCTCLVEALLPILERRA